MYVKHHSIYVEWMNFMSHDSNHNVGKGFFVYKKTYLANLQVYQDSVLIWLNNIYCYLQMFNFDVQEDLIRQCLT